MAKVEIYKTFTIGGQNHFATDICELDELGNLAKDLRKRGLIGPVTKETAARLNATEAAQEKPVAAKTAATPAPEISEGKSKPDPDKE